MQPLQLTALSTDADREALAKPGQDAPAGDFVHSGHAREDLQGEEVLHDASCNLSWNHMVGKDCR